MDKYINANIVFSKFCNEYAGLKKDLPIRPSEMGVLNIIVQREGMFTPLMIAELLEVSKPMVTAHIMVLEKKGYISKEYLKGDKRSFYIVPTEKAKILVENTAEAMNKKLAKLESEMGKEKFNTLQGLLISAHDILKDIKGE